MTFEAREWMTRWPLTRPFGDLSMPQFGAHSGIDLGIPAGTPIPALRDGVVDLDDDDASYDPLRWHTWSGITVRYRLPDGGSILCAHLGANLVSAGETVRAGEPIGYCGATGAATGPHLHLEIRDIDGTLLDPITYVEAIMFTEADRAILMKAAADAAEAKKWATEGYQKSAALGDSMLVWLRRLFFGRDPDTGIARGKELDPGT